MDADEGEDELLEELDDEDELLDELDEEDGLSASLALVILLAF